MHWGHSKLMRDMCSKENMKRETYLFEYIRLKNYEIKKYTNSTETQTAGHWNLCRQKKKVLYTQYIVCYTVSAA